MTTAMKQFSPELSNPSSSFNSLNRLLTSTNGIGAEPTSSSSESLLTLLEAGIQSQNLNSSNLAQNLNGSNNKLCTSLNGTAEEATYNSDKLDKDEPKTKDSRMVTRVFVNKHNVNVFVEQKLKRKYSVSIDETIMLNTGVVMEKHKKRQKTDTSKQIAQETCRALTESESISKGKKQKKHTVDVQSNEEQVNVQQNNSSVSGEVKKKKKKHKDEELKTVTEYQDISSKNVHDVSGEDTFKKKKKKKKKHKQDYHNTGNTDELPAQQEPLNTRTENIQEHPENENKRKKKKKHKDRELTEEKPSELNDTVKTASEHETSFDKKKKKKRVRSESTGVSAADNLVVTKKKKQKHKDHLETSELDQNKTQKKKKKKHRDEEDSELRRTKLKSHGNSMENIDTIGEHKKRKHKTKSHSEIEPESTHDNNSVLGDKEKLVTETHQAKRKKKKNRLQDFEERSLDSLINLNNTDNQDVDVEKYQDTMLTKYLSLEVSHDSSLDSKEQNNSLPKASEAAESKDKLSEAESSNEDRTLPTTSKKTKKRKTREPVNVPSFSGDSITAGDFDHINNSIQEAMERCRPTNEEITLLKNLEIYIPFEVPETHRIETRMSSCPTRAQQALFKNLDIPIKSGPYTNGEDKKIRDNWNEFCEAHDLNSDNPAPFFYFMIDKQSLLNSIERKKFVQYLGRGLENRMLYSIHRRFKVIFTEAKKGKFTEEEDDIIRLYMGRSTDQHKFSSLSHILGRPRAAIKTHHEFLTAQETNVKWSLELMQQLIENIMEVTGNNVVDDLKDAAIEEEHWEQVEQIMGLPAKRLKHRWLINIYPRLFAQCSMKQIREKLINALYDSEEEDRKSINWSQVALDFDGMTGMKLHRIFRELVNYYVPKELRSNFRDSIDFLKNKYLNTAEDTQDHRVKKLITLSYSQGKLFEVK